MTKGAYVAFVEKTEFASAVHISDVTNYHGPIPRPGDCVRPRGNDAEYEVVSVTWVISTNRENGMACYVTIKAITKPKRS